jgi:bacteriorhodopsin
LVDVLRLTIQGESSGLYPPRGARDMKRSLRSGLLWVFFALMAALLVSVAMTIQPKAPAAPAEIAPICSAPRR